MSFIWKADKPLRTPEEIAGVVYDVALKRNLDKLAAAMALMTIATETNFWCPWNAKAAGSNSFPYDSQSDDGRSVGYYQQQTGPNGELWWGSVQSEMTLESATDTFLSRLPDDYTTAKDAASAGVFCQRVQGSAFPDRYALHWDTAWGLLKSITPVEEPPVADSKRPAYNEFPVWSPNHESRQGTPVDLFIIHTQEGGGGNAAAENLAHYLADPNSQVSYHYTVSQASDGGVTVVDCVDTDSAAWSVGDANLRSINLCFAGSSASWTREQWLQQSAAIDVAAYLATQDVAKYSTLAPAFIGTGGIYNPQFKSGVTDHRYVTDVLKWGTHTDVGPNFPADYFADRLSYWAAGGESQAPPPVVAPPPPPELTFQEWVDSATDMDLLRYIAEQLGPGDPSWASSGKTLRDKVWGV